MRAVREVRISASSLQVAQVTQTAAAPSLSTISVLEYGSLAVHRHLLHEAFAPTFISKKNATLARCEYVLRKTLRKCASQIEAFQPQTPPSARRIRRIHFYTNAMGCLRRREFSSTGCLHFIYDVPASSVVRDQALRFNNKTRSFHTDRTNTGPQLHRLDHRYEHDRYRAGQQEHQSQATQKCTSRPTT